MDYPNRGEAKSQPALPQSQRIWATSNLPRSRSLYSRECDLLGQQDSAWRRPPSAALERPESRLSRPSSRAGRPASRLLERREPAVPRTLGPPTDGSPRAMSGKVRPLSGRVFMRRTAEKGWVAKAYPKEPSSQTDLGIWDDLSDCGSLDSFFDDDFDLEPPQEKLNNLLSCNTLGVESRGRKPDWTAGNIAIPEFHCPRCRDHWYGIAEFPCDEELARLIREGLWFTGKEGTMRSVREAKEMGSRGRHLGEKHDVTGGTSSGLPRIKHRGGVVGGQGGEERAVLVPKEDSESERKKSRRRITFKLDDNDSSETDRDGRDKGGRSGARTWTGNTVNDTGNGSNGLLGNHEVDVAGGHGSKRPLGLHGDETGHLTGDSSVSGGLGSSGGRRRKGDGEEGEGGDPGLIGGGSESKLGAARRGRGGRGRDGGDEGSGLLGSGGETAEDKARRERGKKGLLRNTKDAEGDSGSGERKALESSSKSGLGMDRDTKTGSGTQGILGEGQAAKNGQSQQDALTDKATLSGRGSRVSLHSSSQGGHGTDHGKGVRKAAGHMRAASPSQSDWGDPYHARPYLSSTAASSRAGSTSNLHRDQEEEEEEEGRTLPQITSVPAISSKKPFLDLSDLLGGIQFTRAWTFSYHSSDPQTARK